MNNYLKLELQLCFKFYKISRAITRLYQPLLEKIGLTYPQYLVMLVLWEKEKIYFSELSEILELKTGTLSPILIKMKNANLIEKESPENDCRKTLIKLTSKGIELKKEALNIPEMMLQKINIKREELRNLREILDNFEKKL